jgi:hypothetical protein
MTLPTAGTIETVINAAIVAGPGLAFQARPLNRALIAFITGTGPLTASVIYEVSMDGVNWATRNTFTLNSTGYSASIYVDTLSPFPFVRGTLVSITGTGAQVTLQMSGSTGG